MITLKEIIERLDDGPDELVLSRLDGRYFSRRGERRNLELLCRDLASFYAGFRGFPITKERLGRMLKGKATNVLDWCLLAMFAGIPAAELCRLEGAGAPRQEAFDERVRELYSGGMSCALTKKDAAKLLGLKDASLRNLPRLRAMLSGMRKGLGSKQWDGDMRGKPLN